MWAYDLGYEVIWRIGFTDTSYGGALGTVFLNFNKDYTYFYPDYVPGQAALDLYDDADLRYSGYFYQTETGYPHGLSWPLLVKYYGNRNLIANQIYHVSMPKPFRLAEQYLIRAEAYCQKNDFSKAGNDLSTLRKMRYKSGGTINVTKDNWLQTISDERLRELYMEGFRLHDLKRWHKGFERKPQAKFPGRRQLAQDHSGQSALRMADSPARAGVSRLGDSAQRKQPIATTNRP